MAKPKVIAVANQKGGVGKSTSVYNIGAGLAMNGKNILLIDVDPQGDLTKMLGQRKPHDLPVTLGNALNDVVADTENSSHPEILRHHEGFDFVPANRTLSAVEVSLVNVMSRETVLRRYVNSVKKPYDYVLLDCKPVPRYAGHQRPFRFGLCVDSCTGRLSGRGGYDGTGRHCAERKKGNQPQSENRRRISDNGKRNEFPQGGRFGGQGKLRKAFARPASGYSRNGASGGNQYGG